MAYKIKVNSSQMNRYSYRDSMGFTTSVENMIMSGDVRISDASQIFRELCETGQLMTLRQIETMENDPDERHMSYERVKYTVEDVRNSIRSYLYARKHGGKYADCYYEGKS